MYKKDFVEKQPRKKWQDNAGIKNFGYHCIICMFLSQEIISAPADLLLYRYRLRTEGAVKSKKKKKNQKIQNY